MTVNTPEGSSATISVYNSQSIANDDYEESPQLAAFLDTLKEKLDEYIGEARFRPVWKVMFKGIDVVSWKEEENGVYRLTLANAIEAALPDKSGKTFLFEKEILMKFDSENYQIIFPEVLKLKEKGVAINPSDKNLNAIWASEKHLGSLYTGVGYSTRWDTNNQQFVSDNINDAGWWLQAIATPRKKTFDESIKEWSDRSRVTL